MRNSLPTTNIWVLLAPLWVFLCASAFIVLTLALGWACGWRLYSNADGICVHSAKTCRSSFEMTFDVDWVNCGATTIFTVEALIAAAFLTAKWNGTISWSYWTVLIPLWLIFFGLCLYPCLGLVVSANLLELGYCWLHLAPFLTFAVLMVVRLEVYPLPLGVVLLPFMLTQGVFIAFWIRGFFPQYSGITMFGANFGSGEFRDRACLATSVVVIVALFVFEVLLIVEDARRVWWPWAAVFSPVWVICLIISLPLAVIAITQAKELMSMYSEVDFPTEPRPPTPIPVPELKLPPRPTRRPPPAELSVSRHYIQD